MHRILCVETMKKLLALCTCMILITPSLWSHDTWLVPVKYRFKSTGSIQIHHSIGMDFPVSLNAPTADRIIESVVVGDQLRQNLKNHEQNGKSLVTRFTIDRSGSYMIGTSFKAAEIKMKAAKFNAYLLHDGLAHIYRLREQKGMLGKDATERYTKLPKTLIQVGDKIDTSVTQPIGLKLEIVPLTNPYTLTAGETLSVKVLYNGNTLSQANLSWSYPGQGHDFAGTTQTNSKGIAMIPLHRSTAYVIRMTHMEWVQKNTHEWESYWASLTFEVGGTEP